MPTVPTGGYSSPASSSWLGTIGTVATEGIKGVGQGVLNTINGVHDIGIGVTNIGLFGGYNASSWVLNNVVGYDNPYVGFHSPDWSRGLLTDEYGEPGTWGDTHGWSKFAGGNAVLAAYGALGPKMAMSVGQGTASAEGGLGFHVTFNVGGKWYHAGGDKLGKLTMSKPTSYNPFLQTGEPWFTINNIPILSAGLATPVPGSHALTCVTASIGAWIRGGGPVFVIAPFVPWINH